MLLRDDVIKAYRDVLGRDPESEDVIVFHQHRHGEFAELAGAMRQSQEYIDRTASQKSVTDRPVLTIDQIDDAVKALQKGDRERFAGAVLALPDWFDNALDPKSSAYREQMVALWKAITGRVDYDVSLDEDTPEVAGVDFIFRPGYFENRDAALAGGHIMSIGHILVRSELPPGGRVLEYGAGMGQTSLTLARLGAKVDTVDINKAFCRGVSDMGRHFKVDLTSHLGEFGHNPAGHDEAYDLVLFYESFHHCIDAPDFLAKIRRYLKPDGCVILAGEPIFPAAAPEMPYPWGFRLDWENIAIMRLRGWMELGYQRDYFVSMFEAAGFSGEFFPDANSHWAQVWRFRKADLSADEPQQVTDLSETEDRAGRSESSAGAEAVAGKKDSKPGWLSSFRQRL